VARAHLLYGVHAVEMAWLNPDRRCRRLYATFVAAQAFKPTLDKAASLGLQRPQPLVVERDAIEKLPPAGAVHQGLVLDAEPLAETNLDDILIRTGDAPALLVLLDQVTDPHNVGAILRSAAAFGAAGLIVQSRHAPEVTGVLAKAASGAVEIVPIVRETNLSRAIVQLRDAGFQVIGLDETGSMPLSGIPDSARTVLALGAEGAGLRRLVAESCDLLAALPTRPPIGSLNVSNAASVGLYEIARRR
jgi:23S rRNA (guanosine2251-2'-O)-methyltransferase